MAFGGEELERALYCGRGAIKHFLPPNKERESILFLRVISK